MHFVLDNSLGFIISRTSLKLKNNLNKAFKPYDITTEQWGLVNRLWQHDGISQKELSDMLCKDQPTTTRILDKLEHKGLITRQANPHDRREFLIYLTEGGKNLKQVLIPLAEQSLVKALQGLKPEEVDTLKELLNRIFYNLE